jgi:hypothetical protein
MVAGARLRDQSGVGAGGGGTTTDRDLATGVTTHERQGLA